MIYVVCNCTLFITNNELHTFVFHDCVRFLLAWVAIMSAKVACSVCTLFLPRIIVESVYVNNVVASAFMGMGLGNHEFVNKSI